jgi:hypothetical protein
MILAMGASDLTGFSAQLAELKERLMHNPDFVETATYFLDHLGESDAFLKSCHRAKCDKLRAMLGVALQKFLNKQTVSVTQEHLSRARGTPFYHGGFMAEGYIASVIYFDDVAMGLLTLAKSSQVHAFRLTGHSLGSGPIQN